MPSFGASLFRSLYYLKNYIYHWLLIQKIGSANFKCTLRTFKQQLALKMRASCGMSIGLLLTSLHCGFWDSLYMSHFSYVCKMRYPLNLVLESWEYLWSYLTFWVVILDYGLKLHKLSIHTLVMLQK